MIKSLFGLNSLTQPAEQPASFRYILPHSNSFKVITKMFTIFHALSYCLHANGQRYQHATLLNLNVCVLLGHFVEHRQEFCPRGCLILQPSSGARLVSGVLYIVLKFAAVAQKLLLQC